MSAEDVVEFHAARLLLLLLHCGKEGEVDGLTKLAKLDFFVRYPAFFARACKHLGKPVPPVQDIVEAEMVRHHYGPWDHRYYHVLSFLEGSGLVHVRKFGANAYRFTLTETGRGAAERLSERESFVTMRDHMRRVRAVLGNRKGDTLKKLIYELFSEEVAERPLGEVIR
ncbi:MAG: hypothetical protein M3P51_00080 [Chloroflexota bacterium]|nr:hypothetical protein [Chloroflexota bacterium]